MEYINKVISLMERMSNIDKYGYSSLLTEISIQNKHQIEKQNGKTKLPYETFEFICKLDPTTKNNNIVGKYSNWLLSKYNPNTDWDRLRNSLEWYADGAKRGILKRLGINTDINTFNSYDELISVMDELNHSNTQISNSEYNNRQKLEGQFDILGSTSKFDIITCHTWEAERYFGSGTRWCTVANEEYFNDYTNNGQLYIVYPKNGDSNLKMQFYFDNEEYCDKDDDSYDTPSECIETVITNKNECYELLQLCKKIWNEYEEELFIPYQEKFQERVMDAQQQLSNGEKPEYIFDNVERMDNGLYRVVLMNKQNFVRPDNTFVWDNEKWFDTVDNFYNGLARVYINRKGFNYLRTDGILVWDDEKWFDDANNFYNGFASVYLNGKGHNFLRPDGTLVWKDEKWFDNEYYFKNGFGSVYIIDKGWNFLRPDGTLVWKNEKWFDWVGEFFNDLAEVYINGKGYNYLRSDGTLVRKPELKWFDRVDFFNNGFAKVILDGEKFRLDKDGNLHPFN